MRKKGIILSGMRPTGPLHLGHLVGALKNWVTLQDQYECFFMIADIHALMSEYKESQNIRKYSYENIADWIACGIDPSKSTIFIQSNIPQHIELYMFFSTITPIPWLERCPTYKEQLKELKDKDVRTYAFLGYPVLQAADILLYKGDTVPVGEDQLPHLELAREIVRRFHHIFKTNIFPEPQPKLTQTARLLGIDGRKMSKSYNNYIALSDSPEIIKKKTISMFTDPSRTRKTDPGHPDICNVFNYHKIFNNKETNSIQHDCKNAKIGCTDCKDRLGEIIIKLLEPVRNKRDELLRDKKQLIFIIEDGNKKALEVALSTMKEVRNAVFK